MALHGLWERAISVKITFLRVLGSAIRFGRKVYSNEKKKKYWTFRGPSDARTKHAQDDSKILLAQLGLQRM